MTSRRSLATIAGLVGAIALIGSLAGASTWLRPAATLIFLAIGPGLAVVALLRLYEPAIEICIALATSLAVDTIVAMALVWTHFWHPVAGLSAIVVATWMLILVSWIRPVPDSPEVTVTR